MKARRFFNLTSRLGGGSLGRVINPMKHLFYPSTAQAHQHQIQQQQAAAAAKVESRSEEKEKDHRSFMAAAEEVFDEVLPMTRPKFRFNTFSRTKCLSFLPFYGDTDGANGRFLFLDDDGMTVLHDGDAATFQMMPALSEPKGPSPVSFCANNAADPAHDPDHPDALYVMDYASRSFEALVYGDPNPNPLPIDFDFDFDFDSDPNPNPLPIDFDFDSSWYKRQKYVWHWRPLPPPPVLVDKGRCAGSIRARSYALLHGDNNTNTNSNTFCVSFTNRSESDPNVTYCFDTGTGKWTKASDWGLPFFSRGLHVPELGNSLVFGIEDNNLDHRFCAVDVSGAMKMDGSAPVLPHVWADVDPPPRWYPSISSVVYLGDGSFCIHRSFDIYEELGFDSDLTGTAIVLTGVEVVREGSRLRLIKHKFKCPDSHIDSVL